MNTHTFNSGILNEIYDEVFDVMYADYEDDNEYFDEEFGFEEWLDEKVLYQTNDNNGYEYEHKFNEPLLPHCVLIMINEIYKDVFEEGGVPVENFKPDIASLANWAVCAVGERIKRNNSNPLNNEFTQRCFPSHSLDPPADEE